MSKQPSYTREEFDRLYNDVKKMRETGLNIADSCDFSGITINKFNYYRKKYDYGSLKELRFSHDSFKELYDEISGKVKNGITVTKACRSSNIKPNDFYNYLKFHKMPNVTISKEIAKEDFDDIYNKVSALSEEGYTIKASCKKLGIDYCNFNGRRSRYNKPTFRNNKSNSK